MGKIALLLIAMRMVSCIVGEKERNPIPRKALIESVLEYWDNVYNRSIQIIKDGPRLAAFDSDDDLISPSKIKIGLKLIEINIRGTVLPSVIMILVPPFIYQLYIWGDYAHKKSHNKKEVTWVCRCGTILQDRVSERVPGAADSFGEELCVPSVVRAVFEYWKDSSHSKHLKSSNLGTWQILKGWDRGLAFWYFALLLVMMEFWGGDPIRRGLDKVSITPQENLTRWSLVSLCWIIRCSAGMTCFASLKLQQASIRRLAIFAKDGLKRPRSRDEDVRFWFLVAIIIPLALDTLALSLIRRWSDKILKIPIPLVFPLQDIQSPSFHRRWIFTILITTSFFIPAAKLQQTSFRRWSILRRITSKISIYPGDTGGSFQESNAQNAVGRETPQRSKQITPHFGHSKELIPWKRPHKDTTPSEDTRQVNVLVDPQPESLYLLLCIPQYKYATKVVHMDVKSLTSDQQLFDGLRTHYTTMRGGFRMLLSLRKLTSIVFVQFEAYKSDLADVKKENDIPPESRSNEYRYRPMPADVIPPVGRNHMMHLYEHPDHAEDRGICLDRIPKKMKERLAICPNRGTGVGWGVHFSEGLNWLLLYILGLLGLSLGISFGVLWAKFKNDVQGGFGIAACIMLGFSFTVGIVQAAFEEK